MVQESNVASQKQENSSAPTSRKGEPQLAPIAGDRSEPLFAETIHKRAEKANLPPLKSKNLNDDDIEFRMWAGFGKKPLEGFVCIPLMSGRDAGRDPQKARGSSQYSSPKGHTEPPKIKFRDRRRR